MNICNLERKLGKNTLDPSDEVFYDTTVWCIVELKNELWYEIHFINSLNYIIKDLTMALFTKCIKSVCVKFEPLSLNELEK